MRVETLTRGPLNTRTYLVSDGTSADALLIDPPARLIFPSPKIGR